MAISFIGAADLGSNTGTSWTTGSYTASGNFLIIAVIGDTTASGLDDITSVSYGGQSATLAVKNTAGGGAGSARILYLYYVSNPTAGSHTITITNTSSHLVLAGVAEYSGVATSGIVDNTAVNDSGISTPASIDTSLITVADNCFVVVLESGYNSNLAPTAGAGATRRTFDATFGAWGFFEYSGSPVTPAGSTTTTINSQNGSSQVNTAAFSFPPSAGGGGGGGSFILMPQICL